MRKNIFIILLFIISTSGLFPQDTKIKNIEKLSSQALTEKVFGPINNSDEKKSPFLAVILSAILPGAGEYYTNRFDVGKYNFSAEIGLWLLYAGMEIHGYQVRNDGRSFARLHAGFNDDNKNDDYYVDVSNFMSVYDYNDKKLRDRDSKSLYDPISNMAWQWDSEANRKKFREMRVDANSIINNTKFVAIAMVANRLFSAINAGRLTAKYNSQLNLSLAPIGYQKKFDGFSFRLTADF